MMNIMNLSEENKMINKSNYILNTIQLGVIKAPIVKTLSLWGTVIV